MITSVNNGQVKNIIQLNQKTKARREQGLFVAEGRKMFGEAPRDWISKVYVSEALSGDAELMAQVEKLPYEIVTDSVFRQMSDTQTPQGIMTVLKKPSYIMEDILGGKNPLVMILEDLQDPGNAGTILRTGEGAGVSGVLLTKTCVDITNPKVIRSTMGSVYRMPFLYVESVVSLAQELKDRNIRTFAAHLHGKNSYDQESYTGGTAFLIGNEGKGLTDEAADSADCLIRRSFMQLLIWLGILALLLVVEAITAGLTTIWFAGGALVAAIACYAGANLTVQILLFLCVSLVLLIFTRPLAMKYFNKETIQTNANSLIGKKAVVIQEIDNLAQTGQVRINDIEWTARSADDEKIGEGTVVTIEEIRGVKLIVKQNKED